MELKIKAKGKYHFVFVLDESGSMDGVWSYLQNAVQGFFQVRIALEAEDVVTIITFAQIASLVCEMMQIQTCSDRLSDLLIMRGGGTDFRPGLIMALEVLLRARTRYPEYRSVLIFESDGGSPIETCESIMMVLFLQGSEVCHNFKDS